MLYFQRLIEEIDEKIGTKKEISFEDLSELSYTSSIMKETLRMYAPVPMLARKNIDDIQIEEYHIPKESILAVSLN